MKRLIAAFRAFFRALRGAETGPGLPAEEAEAETAAPEPAESAPGPEEERKPAGLDPAAAGAVQALALLQRHGRLIDFLMEDIRAYDDAQVGAAVREIHAGCRKVLDEHFRIEPVLPESEGERVTIEPGFDASRIRIGGRVSGSPPYSGSVVHRGWRAAEVRLPERSAGVDPTVVQPAEIEV